MSDEPNQSPRTGAPAASPRSAFGSPEQLRGAAAALSANNCQIDGPVSGGVVINNNE